MPAAFLRWLYATRAALGDAADRVRRFRLCCLSPTEKERYVRRYYEQRVSHPGCNRLETGNYRLLAEAQRYSKAFDAIVNIVHVADPDPDFVGYIKRAHGVTDYDQTLRDNRTTELRLEHQQAHAVAERMRATGIRVDQALTVHSGADSGNDLEEARKFGAI
jgi:hypothetical protein